MTAPMIESTATRAFFCRSGAMSSRISAGQITTRTSSSGLFARAERLIESW